MTIEPGTTFISSNPGGSIREATVRTIWIYKDNQGKWDCVAVLEYTDPTYKDVRQLQVTLKEVGKAIDNGTFTVKT